MRQNFCRIFAFDHFYNGHSTTNYPNWITRKDDDISQISCFDSNDYEPYTVLRKYQGMPLFDETLKGYGKNKIEHIRRLRALGYNFHVLPRVFFIHVPHAASQSRLNFTENRKQALIEMLRDKYKQVEGQDILTVGICDPEEKVLSMAPVDFWTETFFNAGNVLAEEFKPADWRYFNKVSYETRMIITPPCNSTNLCC